MTTPEIGLDSVLWRTFEEGIKVIFTGNGHSVLSPAQRTSFLDMLAAKSHPNTEDHIGLSAVATRRHCVDTETGEELTLYYLPELFLYLENHHFKRTGGSATVAVDSLRHLFRDAGDADRLNAAIRRVEALEMLERLRAPGSGGDPMNLEAQHRLQRELLGEIDQNTALLERKETAEQRRARLHKWYDEEHRIRGKRGALTRTAEREGIARQTLKSILGSLQS